MGFGLTVAEILIATAIIIGFIFEEKVSDFEDALFMMIKKLIRRHRKNAARKARIAKRAAGRASVSRKYCA